jgi:hypothetical protein
MREAIGQSQRLDVEQICCAARAVQFALGLGGSVSDVFTLTQAQIGACMISAAQRISGGALWDW